MAHAYTTMAMVRDLLHEFIQGPSHGQSHNSNSVTAIDWGHPIPDGSICHQNSMVEVTEQTAVAIARTEYDCHVLDRIERMMQTKLSAEQCNNKSNMLKYHYFEECNKKKSDYVLNETRTQKKYDKRVSNIT